MAWSGQQRNSAAPRQSPRYDSQPSRYDSQPSRYDSQPSRYDSQPSRYESQPSRYEGPPSRYDSRDNYEQGYSQPSFRSRSPPRGGPARNAAGPRGGGGRDAGAPSGAIQCGGCLMWGSKECYSKTQYSKKIQNPGAVAKCKTCISHGKLEKDEATLAKCMKEICVDLFSEEVLGTFENKFAGKPGAEPVVSYKWSQMGGKIKQTIALLERLEDGSLKLMPKKRKLEGDEGDDEEAAAEQPDDENSAKKQKVDEA